MFHHMAPHCLLQFFRAYPRNHRRFWYHLDKFWFVLFRTCYSFGGFTRAPGSSRGLSWTSQTISCNEGYKIIGFRACHFWSEHDKSMMNFTTASLTSFPAETWLTVYRRHLFCDFLNWQVLDYKYFSLFRYVCNNISVKYEVVVRTSWKKTVSDNKNIGKEIKKTTARDPQKQRWGIKKERRGGIQQRKTRNAGAINLRTRRPIKPQIYVSRKSSLVSDIRL